MKKISKTIAAIMLLSLVVMSMSGCFGKKNEDTYTATAEELQAQIDNLGDQNLQLLSELAIYDDKYKTNNMFKKKSIIKSGDSGFNKINDKIVLNGVLTDLNENRSNTANITLSKGIVIAPNKNWDVNISTAETNFSTKGAYGTIKIYDYLDEYIVDGVVAQIIKPFLTQNELKVQTTRDIFVGDIKRGEEATARILIYDSTTVGNTIKVKASDILTDTELEEYKLSENSNIDLIAKKLDRSIDATLRVGLFKTSQGTIEYEFIAEDSKSDIIIDNLLSTLSISGTKVYLQ